MRIAMGLAVVGTVLVVSGLLSASETAVALGVIAVSAAVLRFGWLFAEARLRKDR